MPDPSPRLYIPALGRIYQRLSPCAEVALRVGLGAILFPHGCQKLFGWFGGAGLARFTSIFEGIGYKPGLGLTEALGGLLLVLGLFTRPVALAVVIFMLNAIWVHLGQGVLLDRRRLRIFDPDRPGGVLFPHLRRRRLLARPQTGPRVLAPACLVAAR